VSNAPGRTNHTENQKKVPAGVWQQGEKGSGWLKALRRVLWSLGAKGEGPREEIEGIPFFGI
jgi:hypothetical protein